jgi:DNA-binding XRE family transcriptional regulator
MSTKPRAFKPVGDSFADVTEHWQESDWAQYRSTGVQLSREFVADLNEHRVVGEILKEARTARAYTQAQLAELTGIQQGVISRIEQGEANPSLRTIFKILDATGRTLALAPTTD